MDVTPNSHPFLMSKRLATPLHSGHGSCLNTELGVKCTIHSPDYGEPVLASRFMSNESFLEHNLRAINWAVYTQQIYDDFMTILRYDVMPKRVYSRTTPTPCLCTPVHVETKKKNNF